MMISSPHMQRPPSGGPMHSPQQVQQQQQVQQVQVQQPPPGYVYQKPGLRGGAPIHGFGSRGAKRLPTASSTTGQSGAGQASQAPQNTNSNPMVIVTRTEGMIKEINNVKILKKKPGPVKGALKAASGSRIIHRGKVAHIMPTHDDYDGPSSNSSEMSTSTSFTVQPHTINRTIKRTAAANSCYAMSHTKSSMTAGSMMLDDNIVVIDSSPDEKQQRIIETMDYDDDNDKSVIDAEVSLSSVAQNAMDGDEVSVIYDSTVGNDLDINVSSPLEEEIGEEFQLQFPVCDSVDDGEREYPIESPTEDDTLDDSENDEDDDNEDIENADDDDIEDIDNGPSTPVYLEDIANLDGNSDPDDHFTTTEEDIMSMNSEVIIMDSSGMKTPEDRLHTTDFEAMIDSGNSKDGKESNSSIELMEIEPEQAELPPMKFTTAATATTTAKATNIMTGNKRLIVVVPQSSASSTKPQIGTIPYGRNQITASFLQTKNNVFTTMPTSSSPQNVAKYMYKNKPISVPIIQIPKKNVQLAKNATDASGNKKLLTAAQSTIINTSLANMSTTKKLNPNQSFLTIQSLNLQNQPGGQIIRLQTVRAQPTQQQQHQHQQQTTTASAQRKLTTVGEPTQITKSLPTLTYSKITSLSSLKVTQDVSLPTKLFQEDESISPDSSIEQDEENDLMMTEETIYTTEDSNQNNRDINEIGENSLKSIPSPISSISNQDRIIEVDEMLNDDWKRKSSSSSPIIRSDSQSSISIEKCSSGKSSQDVVITEKQKPNAQIPVHVIIKSSESPNVSGMQPVTARLSTNLPQLSPLSQPNEITTNMANASQQLRSIMSSINPTASTTATANAANQNKVITTTVEFKTIDSQSTSIANNLTAGTTVTAASSAISGTPMIATKTESVTATPSLPLQTSFENVLATNRNNDMNVKIEVVAPKIVTESIQAVATTTGPSSTAIVPAVAVSTSTVTAGKILTSTQAFSQNNIGTIATTTGGGNIFVLKHLRTVSPMTNRSRSPVTFNSSSTTKTQTFSVVKQVGGGSTVLFSGQSAQPGSSVIITQNKILTKVATTNATALGTVASNTTMAVSANPITVSTSMARNTAQQPMSILSNTLTQPQQARITVPYASGAAATADVQQHITISKKPIIKVPLANVVANSSTASSTAAIQNILQSSLHSPHPSASGGSILSATLSQPQVIPKQQNATAKLLQTQLSSNNPYRRSKSTDEVPGFLKETPAQIISKRHSSMEASNTITKEEKDDALISTITTLSVNTAASAAQKAIGEATTTAPAVVSTTSSTASTENCKFTTVTIHKSDETQNVLLKQLLQQASNTTPSPSSLPTIVSRSVTSLRAPSLGVVSSLEAQLARPVILPVPSTPSAIQSKPNTLSTGK